jgi:hypothetical protein
MCAICVAYHYLLVHHIIVWSSTQGCRSTYCYADLETRYVVVMHIWKLDMLGCTIISRCAYVIIIHKGLQEYIGVQIKKLNYVLYILLSNIFNLNTYID